MLVLKNALGEREERERENIFLEMLVSFKKREVFDDFMNNLLIPFRTMDNRESLESVLNFLRDATSIYLKKMTEKDRKMILSTFNEMDREKRYVEETGKLMGWGGVSYSKPRRYGQNNGGYISHSTFDLIKWRVFPSVGNFFGLYFHKNDERRLRLYGKLFYGTDWVGMENAAAERKFLEEAKETMVEAVCIVSESTPGIIPLELMKIVDFVSKEITNNEDLLDRVIKKYEKIVKKYEFMSRFLSKIGIWSLYSIFTGAFAQIVLLLFQVFLLIIVILKLVLKD